MYFSLRLINIKKQQQHQGTKQTKKKVLRKKKEKRKNNKDKSDNEQSIDECNKQDEGEEENGAETKREGFIFSKINPREEKKEEDYTGAYTFLGIFWAAPVVSVSWN